MNILIIGKPSSNLERLLKKSKYAEKVYTAINGEHTSFPNIEYRNFDDILQKAIALKIDIALNTDKNLIKNGIAEFFETKKINLISVNKKWLNLETSRLSAKKLLQYYNINTPNIIRVPLDFPVLIKTDEPGLDYAAKSMPEIIDKLEEFENITTFFEEYIEGQSFVLNTIWDKKNIKYFYPEERLTEVQLDRLDLLKTKLNFMFSDEKANFCGVFGINIIWYKNDWYVKDFDMGTEIPANLLKNTDLIYILNSAIYQKLNEC